MHTKPGPERRRRALLVAALAALRVRNLDAPELRLVHSLLDSWRGIGLIVVGMERHGFQVALATTAPVSGSPLLHRPTTPKAE